MSDSQHLAHRRLRVVEFKQTMLDRVRVSVAKYNDVPVEQVLAESHFVDDLGMDSLAIVELMLDAEEQLGIDIDDADVKALHTVNDAVKYLERRVTAKVGGA